LEEDTASIFRSEVSSVKRWMVYIGLVGEPGGELANQTHRMRRGDGAMSRSIVKSPFQCTREECWVSREKEDKGSERKVGSRGNLNPGENFIPFFQGVNKGLR
jgi:hypothetical protein